MKLATPTHASFFNRFIGITFIFLISIPSCQPKAQYETIIDPMKGFTANLNDSVRGAKSMQDLTCYFFLALQGKITFEQFKHFIPDSADIANIYKFTETPLPADIELKANQ